MKASPPGWLHTSAFYAFTFLALGAHLPFWPLWLTDWGLTETEIGLYTGAAIAVRVVAGVAIPWAADRAGAPRRALAMLGFAGAAIFLAHVWIETRPFLLMATFAAASVMAGGTPIADALSLRAADRGGFAFATARAMGSAAFLAANVFCGLAVARWGSDAALWWIVVSTAPLVWLGLRHPGGAGAPLPTPRLGEAGALLGSRAFVLTMIAGAALQGSHSVLYAYGSIHWRSQGIDDGTIGALWALGVALEVALMLFAGKALIARLGPAGAMALSGAVGAARWGLMTLDPALTWLWPLQALHAITFTAAFLGALEMVRRLAPESLAATAQGMVGAMAGGLVMAGGSFAAAWAYPIYGGGAYWIGAALALIGLIAAEMLRNGTGGARDAGA
ncbi:MAG: MFS transporter [Pseudomonadota bacterium]